jgi:tryptophan synthase beta chain
LDKMEIKEGQVIVLNLSGRGDKDLETYIDHLK